MSRAMERLKKKREKDKENEPNKKDNVLFKSARIKNLVDILEEQMGGKNIELGGKKSDEIKNDNQDHNLINTENNNTYEGIFINKKKKAKKEFDE